MLQSYKPGGGGGVGGSSGSIQMKLGGVKLNSRHHQTFAAGHDVDDDSSTAGAFKKVGPQELSSASAIESRSDLYSKVAICALATNLDLETSNADTSLRMLSIATIGFSGLQKQPYVLVK